MVHQVAHFSDAYTAWEGWNLTSFDFKRDYLNQVEKTLFSKNAQWSAVMGFHIGHATRLLGETHQLVGPTGETNELYTAGRGVTLIIQEDTQDGARKAVLSQLTCALVAGNSVIVCSDDNQFVEILESAFKQVSFVMNVIQFVSHDAYQQLLDSDIRSIGYIGNQETERTLNRQLSKRPGAIVSLTSETDLDATPVAQDPNLSLRFITERTRTINITAVGGNATLLELGSEAH